MPRAQFQPSPEQRRLVEMMVGLGIPEAEICGLIINPQTGNPISEPTLRKHFRAEIAKGAAGLKSLVGQFVVNTILGRTVKVKEQMWNADGTRVIEVEKEVPLGLTDQGARATLTIFFCKTRMGWKETTRTEIENADGRPFIIQINKTDAKL